MSDQVIVTVQRSTVNVDSPRQPIVGTVGIAGPQGSPGQAGTGATYRHTQITPAATWTIVHGLGVNPDVSITSAEGDQLFAEVNYPDLSTVVIVFGEPYAGTALLRA